MSSDKNLFEIPVKTIEGKDKTLSEYQGKVLCIVNVASKCGLTPQYEGLEALYREYKDRGFVVLGFPCNQFMSQEPGTEEEIQKFCSINYNVSFPLFSKIEVNGEKTHPLYQFLKSEEKGILGTEAIKWNFTKFLVNKKGEVVKRVGPQTEPKDMEKEIQKLLSE